MNKGMVQIPDDTLCFTKIGRWTSLRKEKVVEYVILIEAFVNV